MTYLRNKSFELFNSYNAPYYLLGFTFLIVGLGALSSDMTTGYILMITGIMYLGFIELNFFRKQDKQLITV